MKKVKKTQQVKKPLDAPSEVVVSEALPEVIPIAIKSSKAKNKKVAALIEVTAKTKILELEATVNCLKEKLQKEIEDSTQLINNLNFVMNVLKAERCEIFLAPWYKLMWMRWKHRI